MASQANSSIEIDIPELPVKHGQFIKYINAHADEPLRDLLAPFKGYDAELRKVFAQQPSHPAADIPNYVPVFTGHERHVRVRARNIQSESEHEKQCYIMPLSDEKRKPDGSAAIVQSLREFQTNFNIFSESALVDMDWSNVVVAGSAVVTPLLAVPPKNSASKRALREYYHEKLAPASDVDLFLYGMDEEQAKEKIKQIEQHVRDAILSETTTVRTKNAITIVSQYPVRHIQIVLRIYKNISEILTGFDVDCSCAAYDGSQVYASPRALTAYMTQINPVDLTRRSPSYENRLSKYAHRGFEIYWPLLDRSRVDPTIFERSFVRTEGLARLLVLEKLPKHEDREAYLAQRRQERGRPHIDRWRANRGRLRGDIKLDWEDEVPEWDDEEDVSNYHTFTIPYGPRISARKVERLLFTKDLLLNAEWNADKNREVHLHRHPAFFGRAEDVFSDCCGFCPQPNTPEEEQVAAEESKIYISGDIAFLRDNPGRQTIGSFNPLSATDWTEMAYIGNTAGLCQAIVDGDLEHVQTWLKQEGNDPNTRDCTGRAPLHLAVMNSTLEIVQCLIDHGARLIARLVDGKTALHLAAMRGDVKIVSALLRKSEANEEEESRKTSAKQHSQGASKNSKRSDNDVDMSDAVNFGNGVEGSKDTNEEEAEDEDLEMLDEDEIDDDDDMDATTEGSMIKVKRSKPDAEMDALNGDDDKNEPDVYDVNVLAWDTGASPLHLAIISGHVQVVKCLVQEFGADVLLPIKLLHSHDNSARGAILTLVLALSLPIDKAREMTNALLELGATISQADMQACTTLHYVVADRPEILDDVRNADAVGFQRAINTLARAEAYQWSLEFRSPLMVAIQARDSLTALKLLTNGAKGTVTGLDYLAASKATGGSQRGFQPEDFLDQNSAPVLAAIECELPDLAITLIQDYDADVNTVTKESHRVIRHKWQQQAQTILDLVQQKIYDLAEWRAEKPNNAPIPLDDDSKYLSGFPEGTFANWAIRQQLTAAREIYKHDLLTYERAVKEQVASPGAKQKKAAIEAMLNSFKNLERIMIQRGAKSFYDLHPDIEKPENQQHRHWQGNTYYSAPQAFKVGFTFGNHQCTDMTSEMMKHQLELFEAAWIGDLATIKKLTLHTWTTSSGTEQPPLSVSLRGQSQLTPFSIAVLRGHLDVASSIMEIALAQYNPKTGPKQRFRLGHTDDDDSDGESTYEMYAEIVDEQFTIETIGQVSALVDSNISPLQLLAMPCVIKDLVPEATEDATSADTSRGFTYFGPRRSMAAPSKHIGQHRLSKEKRKWLLEANTPLQFAIKSRNMELLDFLLSLGEHYTRIETEHEDDQERFYYISETDLILAIQQDDPALLSTLIRRTGAGLSFKPLGATSGLEQEVKKQPKYYQGLNVNGKKRKDWANAGRKNADRERVTQDHSPPILLAAKEASGDVVRWFLSDAPLLCYRDFATTYKDDKRVMALYAADGGLERSIAHSLNSRSNLLMHCCVVGSACPERVSLLQYLVEAMPAAIETKTLSGCTPLLLAFDCAAIDQARILIAAGADQTTHDKNGMNIAHRLLSRVRHSPDTFYADMPPMLQLVDKRVLPSLLHERTNAALGTETPLAAWLKFVSTIDPVRMSAHDKTKGENQTACLRLIIQNSAAVDLNLVNGKGETPLHTIAQMGRYDLAQVALEQDPTLLLRENAVGRTPLEDMEEAEIATCCRDPPPMPARWRQDFEALRARQQDLPADWATGVLERSTESFVWTKCGDTRNAAERTRDLFRETLDRLRQDGIAKRRLVTLAEANEIAKRLATNKGMSNQRRMRAQRYGGDDEEGSQVDGESAIQQVESVGFYSFL